MTNRPARITQAEIARAIRAAKQEGAGCVEIADGKIRIDLSPQSPAEPQSKPVEGRKEIVL